MIDEPRSADPHAESKVPAPVQAKTNTQPVVSNQPSPVPPPAARSKDAPEGFVKIPITEDSGEGEESEEEAGKTETGGEGKKEKMQDIWTEEDLSPAMVVEPDIHAAKETMTAEELEQRFADFNKVKEEGKKLHSEGKYDLSIAKYKECLTIVQNIKRNSQDARMKQIHESEFAKRESIAYSNMAVCYKQMQDPNKAIEYSSKVIDSSLADTNIRMKALILRAFAYESIDKLLLSKEDWTRVKELQPDNLEASKALNRVNEALQRDKAQRVGDTLKSLQKFLDAHKQLGNEQCKASTQSVLMEV